MKKSNILLVFGVFIVGVVIGILGTISFMDGEPKKATIPHSIEEKEQVPPVDEVAVPSVVEDTEENTDTDQNENVTPPPPRPMGVNTSYFEGPFGVDSQKILNGDDIFGLRPKYVIGIVGDIDLEKNDDGTWYIDNCELSNFRDKNVYFVSPYPQQGDLKESDFIGFAAHVAPYLGFTEGKMLENISSQSVNCRIDNIEVLSVPVKKRGVRVTGVVMAVEIRRNRNPEPDNPSDYLINRAVMKCADGNLYIANFDSFSRHSPSHDAFGEGDVVTVEYSYFEGKNRLEFAAYYKKEE